MRYELPDGRALRESMIDHATYPRLAEYIAQLPDGLASYPECKSKGALITTALEGHDLRHATRGLPEEISQLIVAPPPSWSWVPATWSDAMFYVLVDTFYPTPEAVLEWTYERTIKASSNKLYRALTRVSGPSALLRMTAAAHGLFQKGTDMSSERVEGGAILRMTHPPFLHCGLNHLSNVGMIRALLEITGARDHEVEMTASEPTQAIYRATWT